MASKRGEWSSSAITGSPSQSANATANNDSEKFLFVQLEDAERVVGEWRDV
jgi:hypothetical protein